MVRPPVTSTTWLYPRGAARPEGLIYRSMTGSVIDSLLMLPHSFHPSIPTKGTPMGIALSPRCRPSRHFSAPLGMNSAGAHSSVRYEPRHERMLAGQTNDLAVRLERCASARVFGV